jgi:hypothetical protein
LPHGMGSNSHRFTMPTDPWRTDLMPEGRVERLSPWAKVQVKRSKLLFEIQRKTECHRSALFSPEIRLCANDAGDESVGSLMLVVP